MDQLGREVEVPLFPQRIVSVVPSQSEFLFDLGLGDRITGITKFCIHPRENFKSKAKVGGTKSLDIEKIKSLEPDLIIANKEENDPQQISALMNQFPVWVSDIRHLEDAYAMMQTVGALVSERERADDIINRIRPKFSALQFRNSKHERYDAAYLIWRDPYMTAGADTFIHEMMTYGGFRNVYEDSYRYPAITVEDLKQRSPHYVLLSSEPYPFKEKHLAELQEELSETAILLVDGEMFSWYGSRLLKAPDYFRYLHTLL